MYRHISTSPYWEPNPGEIAQRCQAIQSRWSVADRWRHWVGREEDFISELDPAELAEWLDWMADMKRSVYQIPRCEVMVSGRVGVLDTECDLVDQPYWGTEFDE